MFTHLKRFVSCSYICLNINTGIKGTKHSENNSFGKYSVRFTFRIELFQVSLKRNIWTGKQFGGNTTMTQLRSKKITFNKHFQSLPFRWDYSNAISVVSPSKSVHKRVLVFFKFKLKLYVINEPRTNLKKMEVNRSQTLFIINTVK